MTRSLVRRCALIACSAGVAGALLAACGDDDADDDGAATDVDAIAAVVGHLLPPVDDPEVRPVVFVTSLTDDVLSLEDQVVVIERFATSHDVRFVDEIDAALATDLDGMPPRDDGIVLGLGEVSAEQPYTVRVEVYLDSATVTAHLLTVAARGAGWTITADEPVDPEVLDGGR